VQPTNDKGWLEDWEFFHLVASHANLLWHRILLEPVHQAVQPEPEAPVHGYHKSLWWARKWHLKEADKAALYAKPRSQVSTNSESLDTRILQDLPTAANLATPIRGLPKKMTKQSRRLQRKMVMEMRKWVMSRMRRVEMIGNTASAIALVTAIWLLVIMRAVSWSGFIGVALVWEASQLGPGYVQSALRKESNRVVDLIKVENIMAF
jgi:hypothetical protein